MIIVEGCGLTSQVSYEPFHSPAEPGVDERIAHAKAYYLGELRDMCTDFFSLSSRVMHEQSAKFTKIFDAAFAAINTTSKSYKQYSADVEKIVKEATSIVDHAKESDRVFKREQAKLRKQESKALERTKDPFRASRAELSVWQNGESTIDVENHIVVVSPDDGEVIMDGTNMIIHGNGGIAISGRGNTVISTTH